MTVARFIGSICCWATCMLLDYWAHRIGVHKGPWHWKHSLVTFGIGTILATLIFGPI